MEAFVNGLLIFWRPPNIRTGLSNYSIHPGINVVGRKSPWEASAYPVECFYSICHCNRLIEIIHPLSGHSLSRHRRLWDRICAGKDNFLLALNRYAETRIALLYRLKCLHRNSKVHQDSPRMMKTDTLQKQSMEWVNISGDWKARIRDIR